MQIRPASGLDLVARSQILQVQGHYGHQPVQGRHHGGQVSGLAVPGGHCCLQVLTARAEEVPEHRRGQLIPLSQEPPDPLGLAGSVLAGRTVSGISGKLGRFPQAHAQGRRQAGDSVGDLVRRHRRASGGSCAASPERGGMEGAKAMALRPLTAAPRANVNAGYMSADSPALADAMVRDQLEDVPACGEHGGQAVGIGQTLMDQLDLVHAVPILSNLS